VKGIKDTGKAVEKGSVDTYFDAKMAPTSRKMRARRPLSA
jgi:hypothetical protein